MARSFEANSSFDSPATHSFPSTSAMSVTVSLRGLRRPAALAAGAFGRSTFENLRPDSDTASTLPPPSTRNSAGAAPAPCPRITETKALRERGWTARSVMVISAAAVPSIAASVWLMASSPLAPGVAPAAWAPRSSE